MLKIGLIGTFLNNKNLGCVALACSTLKLLHEIEDKKNMDLEVILFESDPNENNIKLYENELNIKLSKLTFSKISWVYSIRGIPNLKKQMQMKKNIKSCNAIIDFTGGDSFSDIYGKERFYFWSNIKKFIIKQNIPLILGPQTYGPYNNPYVKKVAKYIIDNAALVITRDQKSREYIESFSKKEIYESTDVAFNLPYKKNNDCIKSNKIKIGLNISGLLYSNNSDSHLEGINYSVNYKQYILQLIKKLLEEDLYEICLIPHVESDMSAIMEVEKMYTKCKVLQLKNTPMEAKADIAQCDIFLGSRMHATIAAFSSHVATIPIAYSRKFAGLFENIGYSVIIDLEKMQTKEAIYKTYKYIKDYINIKEKVLECDFKVQKKYNKNVELIGDFLEQIKGGRNEKIKQ